MKTDIHGFLRACRCRGAIQPAMVQELLKLTGVPKTLNEWQNLCAAATLAAWKLGWEPEEQGKPYKGPRAKVEALNPYGKGVILRFENRLGTEITWNTKTGVMFVRGCPLPGQAAWRWKAARNGAQ